MRRNAHHISYRACHARGVMYHMSYVNRRQPYSIQRKPCSYSDIIHDFAHIYICVQCHSTCLTHRVLHAAHHASDMYSHASRVVNKFTHTRVTHIKHHVSHAYVIYHVPYITYPRPCLVGHTPLSTYHATCQLRHRIVRTPPNTTHMSHIIRHVSNHVCCSSYAI